MLNCDQKGSAEVGRNLLVGSRKSEIRKHHANEAEHSVDMKFVLTAQLTLIIHNERTYVMKKNKFEFNM